MSMRTGIFLCVYMSAILRNFGYEDKKVAENAGAGNALVAVGREDDHEEASVEGMG